MGEHDDDLEPAVDEDAEMEIEPFPDAGDQVDAVDWDADRNDEELDLDEDDAEAP